MGREDDIEYAMGAMENARKRTYKTNHRSIPDIKGLELAVFGIFLLIITFLIALTLYVPRNFVDFEGYYNAIRLLYIAQFFGLVFTFSGIVLMIYSFYESWKDAMNKLFEKLK